MKLNSFSIILGILLFFAACNIIGNSDDKQSEPITVKDPLPEIDDDELLDSLLQLAATMQQDTNLAMLYYKIGEIYENCDFETTKEYYLKMNDLNEQLDWNQGRYTFAIGFSHILSRQGFVDSAIAINLQALELAKKEKDELNKSRIAFSIGNAYLLKQWHETALNYYLEALSVFEKKDDQDRLGNVYFQLSELYADLDAVDKAIEFGEKAVALDPNESYYLAGLAKAYYTAQQYEKANHYFEKALEICLQENNLYMTGWIYYLSSENALMSYDLKKAEMYAQNALEVNLEIDNMGAYGGALSVLSKVEELRGNFTQSEAHIKEALQIVTDLENLQGQSACYKTLSELAIAQHKYKEHIQYLKEWGLVEAKMAKETSLRAANEIEAKYETTKKEFEIETQRQIIRSRILQRNLLAVGVVICVIFLILLWLLFRLRIRRNYALEELNATKDRLLSIISHDLKNPALAQRDAIRILLDNKVSWDADTLNDYYQKMLKSADGQVDLLYNLLDWARVQTGRIQYQPVQFDFAAEMRKNEFSLLRNMANNKGIEFVVEMPNTVLAMGDANLLATVARNLLENAVKFTTTGGRVTLAVEPKENGKFVVSVTDTGIGMSDEQIQNIFRLDSKIPKRGTAGEPGTGLGLIVCKELLEKHGTTLHVESKINEGSCFWFEI
jgi:signal transduction histidine kinase